MARRASAAAVARGAAREIGPLPYSLDDLALAPGSLVSDDLQLDWLEATALVSGATVLVPRDCVTLSKLVRPGWAPPTFAASSNGLGSGNSLAEATLAWTLRGDRERLPRPALRRSR